MRIQRLALFCTMVPLLAASALAAGCTDAQGNRITMQEWLSKPPAESKDSQTPKGREVQAGTDQPKGHSSTTRAAVGASSRSRENSEKNESPRDTETPPPKAASKERARISAEEADDRQPASAEDSPARPEAPTNAIHSDILLVNKETISVNDVLEPISPELERLSAEVPPNIYFGRATELIRQQIIEAVAQQLVWRKAQQSINEEMEKSLKKAVDKMEKDRINREFQGRETIYDKYLAKHGKTREQVRERLRRSIVIDSYLREKLLPLVPNPRKPELLNYYNANPGEFSKTGRREMFLIDLPIGAFLEQRRSPSESQIQEATTKARAAAEEAAAALKAGEPFEDVAKRLSRGANAEQGGAWGFIEQPLKGRWETPSKKLFEMKEGETSEVLEAARSFFIVKVGKVEERKITDFNESQPQIANTLKQRRFNKLRADFLQDELKKSTIGSLDDFVAEVLRAVPDPKTSGR